jgi:hypothetical protein
MNSFSRTIKRMNLAVECSYRVARCLSSHTYSSIVQVTEVLFFFTRTLFVNEIQVGDQVRDQVRALSNHVVPSSRIASLF